MVFPIGSNTHTENTYLTRFGCTIEGTSVAVTFEGKFVDGRSEGEDKFVGVLVVKFDVENDDDRDIVDIEILLDTEAATWAFPV